MLAWVYVLLLPLAGAAELAGLIDHAIGRRRRWCLTATLSGRRAGKAGKQAKKLFLRAFPLHQLQRHFFCFGSRPLATSSSPSFLHCNCTIPLAFCSLSRSLSTAQHSSAHHPNPSAAPLSQQSSICLRSLTPPSRVREYLAFLFLLLKHDGTRCASSPSCWLCRASRILPKTVSTPFQLACAESSFKVLSEIVFHHGN